jgi:hypothetical protein
MALDAALSAVPSRAKAPSASADVALTFLDKTTLHYGDFARSPDGSLMLHPQLTRLLLAECRVPQSRGDEHARWLKSLLLCGVAREDAPAE